MERLTRKLKKGGYSANRHPAAQIDERLSQLKGVHKQCKCSMSFPQRKLI